MAFQLPSIFFVLVFLCHIIPGQLKYILTSQRGNEKISAPEWFEKHTALFSFQKHVKAHNPKEILCEEEFSELRKEVIVKTDKSDEEEIPGKHKIHLSRNRVW